MKHSLCNMMMLLAVGTLLGCGQAASNKPAGEGSPPAAKSPAESGGSQATGTPAAKPTGMTEAQLKAALKEKNPNFQGEVEIGADPSGIIAVKVNDEAIEDISPLAGLPLRGLDLARCHITDISALRGAR